MLFPQESTLPVKLVHINVLQQGACKPCPGSAKKTPLNLPENCRSAFLFVFLSFLPLFFLTFRKGCRRASQPHRALIASACSRDAVKSLREWSPVLTQSCWPTAPAAPLSRHALPLAAAKGAGEAPAKDLTSGRRSAWMQSGQRKPWVRHALTPSQAAQLWQGV